MNIAQRRSVALLAVFVCFGSWGLSARAQPAATNKIPQPEVKTFTTKDGTAIKGTYYGSGQGKESPCVILLHMKGGNRYVWKAYAETLQKDGFAVVTLDLRHHGDSRAAAAPAPAGGGTGTGASVPAPKLKPVDFMLMVDQDLPAVKKFLVEEHNNEKLNAACFGDMNQA